MKYIKILILISMVLILTACNNNEQDELLGTTEYSASPEFLGTVLEPITDNNLIEELSRFRPVPYLTGVLDDDGIQSLILIDLITGEELATYVSVEGFVTSSIADLEN